MDQALTSSFGEVRQPLPGADQRRGRETQAEMTVEEFHDLAIGQSHSMFEVGGQGQRCRADLVARRSGGLGTLIGMPRANWLASLLARLRRRG